MKRKSLSEEDRALWERVKQSATPLHRAIDAPEIAPKKVKTAKHHPKVTPFELGETARATTVKRDLAPTIQEQLHAAPLRMDRKAFTKMKGGKLKPEAKLDLHGHTLAQAHPELTDFILRCHARGFRLVLVVTGKGKDRDEGGPIPIRRGVLRHQVPVWLSQPPLGALVLQVTQAHLRHGGGGAYYVYLRRRS